MPKGKSTWRLPVLSSILVALVMVTIAYELLMNRFYEPRRSAALIERAIRDVSREFVEPVRAADLTQAALAGMVTSLGDPNTRLLVGKDYQSFQEATQATYAGIGILLGYREDEHYVMEVFDASPAGEAGVLENDIIAEVDGQNARGLSPEDVSAKVRGKEGTKVELGLRRGDMPETLKIQVERRRIELDTVYHQMLEDQLGYLFIVEFATRTRGELEDALGELRDAGMKGLIVDLRRNPGGLLGQGVDVADAFLTAGVIVTVRQRGKADDVYIAEDDGDEPRCPTAVLLDGASASASEIVAAALKENAGAVIVGTKSFGKGSVQKIFELAHKEPMAIQLTVGKYLTPRGRWIGGGQGIAPDVEVGAAEGFVMRYYKRRQPAQDRQLGKAVEVLLERISQGSSAQTKA